MDHRCPVCSADLKRRKLSQAIVARMEIECSYCKNALQLNIHRLEVILVLFVFGAIVVLAALAYWVQSQSLALTAFGVAMAGSLALPLLERIYLRSWPRYVSSVRYSDR